MDPIRLQSPDGRCIRIEPAGNDRFKFTEYAPVSNANYIGQGPVPGDEEPLETPFLTMSFEPPKPKAEKAKPSKPDTFHKPHYDPPMTLNEEEALPLPSMA